MGGDAWEKKVSIGILLALIMVTVTGCGYADSERNEALRKQGRNGKLYKRKIWNRCKDYRDKLSEIQFKSGAGFFSFSHRKCIRENEVQDFLL